jgi:hypothetical protein
LAFGNHVPQFMNKEQNKNSTQEWECKLNVTPTKDILATDITDAKSLCFLSFLSWEPIQKLLALDENQTWFIGA